MSVRLLTLTPTKIYRKAQWTADGEATSQGRTKRQGWTKVSLYHQNANILVVV